MPGTLLSFGAVSQALRQKIKTRTGKEVKSWEVISWNRRKLRESLVV